MDPTIVSVVVLVVILLVVVAVVAAVVRRKKERERRQRLQERFGGEYDRAVASGDPRSAEARLAKAEKDRDRLQIHPLTAESRRRRKAQWQAVQADFVEVPVEAVDAADELVREVMAERGYPRDDNDHAITLLAADHADTVEHYRTAEAHRARFRSGEGSTEDLRRAFVDYRRLFDVLVEEGADAHDPADDSALIDGSIRPDGTPMTADDYVRQQQAGRSATAEPLAGAGAGAASTERSLGDRMTDRADDRADDRSDDHDGDRGERRAEDQDRTLGDRVDRLRREADERASAGSPSDGTDRLGLDHPAGQHAARHEVDVRDQRDPAPAPTPVGDGATRATDGR